MEKLLPNGHKKGFNEMTFDEISRVIYEESEEVCDELMKRNIDYELLRLECADLANGCFMMIALSDRKLAE